MPSGQEMDWAYSITSARDPHGPYVALMSMTTILKKTQAQTKYKA